MPVVGGLHHHYCQIYFGTDNGTVSREDIGEPEPGPIVLAEARKAAKRGASGTARAAFDGRWSVVITTRSGPCDPQYRFGVRIANGNITYEGGGAASAQGRVLPNGTVTVSVSSGPQAANGQGRLSRDYGTGTWRGQGPGGVCSGAWQASRQGCGLGESTAPRYVIEWFL